MIPDLNACSFCKTIHTSVLELKTGNFQVVCWNCNANGPVCKTEKEAVSRWNKVCRQKVLTDWFAAVEDSRIVVKLKSILFRDRVNFLYFELSDGQGRKKKVNIPPELEEAVLSMPIVFKEINDED